MIAAGLFICQILPAQIRAGSCCLADRTRWQADDGSGPGIHHATAGGSDTLAAAFTSFQDPAARESDLLSCSQTHGRRDALRLPAYSLPRQDAVVFPADRLIL